MSILAWAGLAVTTFGAALLQAAGGFGFAVLAAPLYLTLIAPANAVQLVIIIATALTVAVLPGLWRAVAPGLLLRLALGSLIGMPAGLAAFRYSNPLVVRVAAGTTILAFAGLLAALRRRGASRQPTLFTMSRSRDVAAGAVSGAAAALVGMAGPPVLIYLLLAGAASQTIRATLLAFFSLVYAATLAAHAATIGVPAQNWIASGILLPFAFVGGVVGRSLGDRLNEGGFAVLAIALLAGAGLFTLAAAAGVFAGR